MAKRRDKLINATATPKSHTHVEADVTDLQDYLLATDNATITGAWGFDGAVTIGTGDHAAADSLMTFDIDRSWEIKQYSADASAALALHSNNTGKRFVLTNPSDQINFEFAPSTTEPHFRIWDAGATDYVTFAHNGTSLNATAVTTEGVYWKDFDTFRIYDGAEFYIFDSTDADYFRIKHDGTDTYFNSNAGGLDLSGISGDLAMGAEQDFWFAGMNTRGRMRCDTASCADDATITLNAGSSYRLHILMNNYNASALAMWFATSNTVFLDVVLGSNVQRGTTTNPDVDTDVNIWHPTANTVSIKNRLGSTRSFTLWSIGL